MHDEGDSNGWIRFSDIEPPKGTFILVCIQIVRGGLSGKKFVTYDHSTAWWSVKQDRWNGEWRYFADFPEASNFEPVYWKRLDVPVEYAAYEMVSEVTGAPPADDTEIRNASFLTYERGLAANIYLDIDGVLLGKELAAAPHAREFLHYILDNYPYSTYWLTTHCKGDTAQALEHVRHSFDAETFERLKMIKPTVWDMSKTEGIDFNQPFLWFDDDLFPDEKNTLIKHEVLENWIGVNLHENQNQLAQFLEDFPIPVQKSNLA